MPYFFVIPAYVVFVALMLGLAVALHFSSELQPASGYIVGGTIGSVPAFILANIVVTLAGLLPNWLTRGNSLPNWLDSTLKVIGVLVLFVGPFLASIASIVLGFAAGVYVVFKRRRRIINHAAESSLHLSML